jgi:hypothetical protein
MRKQHTRCDLGVLSLSLFVCCFFSLQGQNFGSTDLGNPLTVQYGPTGTELFAEDCFISINHTQITCNTTPGAGSRLKWSVIIGALRVMRT